MAEKDFYADPNAAAEDVVAEEPEKIKLGEAEYSQDELNKLVNLGKIAQEAEEKYDRPISKFWPEYTKTRQELDTLKAKEVEREQAATTAAQTPDQLTEAQLRQQAREQAKNLGLLTTEDANEYIRTQLEGFRLLDSVNSMLNTASADGKPRATAEELLGYMNETGIRNPQDAYDIKYKEELKSWEQRQLSTIKQTGMTTETASTAGAKQPEPIKVTNDNLSGVLSDFLNRNGMQ